MKTNTSAAQGYIPGIDGLRAVAVISVVLFHMHAMWLPGGFAGVDVFFVISGYVVSASLAHKPTQPLTRYLLGFYTRRIVRIFPALLTCILLTGLITSLVVPQSWLSETTSKTALAAVFGLSNFALVLFSDGYFSPRAEFNPFTHTWSLAVEEQFYLIFPLLFYAWARSRSRDGAPAQFSRNLIPAALLASLAYCIYATSSKPDLAYYMLPSRFWELACGAVLFRLHLAHHFIPSTPHRAGYSIIAGATLIGATFALANAKDFPFPWAIPAVVGAVLVISGAAADTKRRSWPGRLMGSRPMTYIGKISYSLYLWHWPVLVLMRWTSGLETFSAIIGAAAISLMLASASYHFIEQGTWWRRRINCWSPNRTACYGLVGILMCAAFLQAILKSQPLISLSVTRDRQTWYPYAWPSNNPTRASAGPLANQKIFVWGDSHAGAYSTMLQILREQTGAEVIIYSRAGCAIAGLRSPSSELCKTRISDTVQAIKGQASTGDIVFLASLRLPRLADQWEVFDSPKKTDSSEIEKQRLSSIEEANDLITNFEQVGIRVMIDAPKPIFKSPPFRCADKFNSENPICAHGFELDRSFLEEHRKPVMDALAQLKSSHPALVVWDPLPTLCPTDKCSAFEGRIPLFFDADHLSAYGNRVLYPSFLAAIAPKSDDHGAPQK